MLNDNVKKLTDKIEATASFIESDRIDLSDMADEVRDTMDPKEAVWNADEQYLKVKKEADGTLMETQKSVTRLIKMLKELDRLAPNVDIPKYK